MADTTLADGPLGDVALAARAAGGDGAAFAAIMRANNQRLFRVARAILGDPVEAEEAVQEAYVSAYRALAGFTGQARLSTWLTAIVVNEARGRLRRRARLAAYGNPEDWVMAAAGAAPAPSPDPEDESARREAARLVERAVEELAEPFRTVFVMRAVEELSGAETAAALGIPEETVKTRFHRARQALKRTLAREVATGFGQLYPFAGRRCDRVVAAVLVRLGLSTERAPPGD